MTDKTIEERRKELDESARKCLEELAKPVYDDPKYGPIRQLIDKYGKDGKLLWRFKTEDSDV